MLLTEYNEVEQMELFKEDGRKEGRKEGRTEGRKEGTIGTLMALVQKGLLSVQDAADQAGITETAFLKILHDNSRGESWGQVP